MLVFAASQRTPTAATQSPPPGGDAAAVHGAVLKRYCVSCHRPGKENNNYMMGSYADVINSGLPKAENLSSMLLN